MPAPSRIRAALPAAALLFTLSAPPAVANETLRFRVFLGDRPIGEHSFRINERGDQTQVTSQARFDVDFLFINAYRYRHTSQETFRDGCLAAITASTDDNGKRSAVAGRADGAGLRLERPTGPTTTAGCIKTFAYWDRDFLREPTLLNPQTGELEPVTVRPTGTDRIEVNGREVSASRYALSTDELTIDLWYHDELGWVGLESDTGVGGRLIYRRM